jgi:D-beta-D-heptose 7-phosphate kinase/D-beta-D-heptose 1-phosphate adenosyltransferase
MPKVELRAGLEERCKVRQISVEAAHHNHLNFNDRYIENLEEAKKVVEALRSGGCRIVLTSGTFDLVHIGHARYTQEAKRHGDVLIVGVDDDIKARGRKGENRPVVPELERLEILTHLRWVDLVVLKHHDEERWGLIKLIRPDVLVLVEGTYGEAEINELEKFVGEVKVLPRQAETSTSANVRKMMLGGAEQIMRHILEIMPAKLNELLSEHVPEIVQATYRAMKEGEKKDA